MNILPSLFSLFNFLSVWRDNDVIIRVKSRQDPREREREKAVAKCREFAKSSAATNQKVGSLRLARRCDELVYKYLVRKLLASHRLSYCQPSAKIPCSDEMIKLTKDFPSSSVHCVLLDHFQVCFIKKEISVNHPDCSTPVQCGYFCRFSRQIVSIVFFIDNNYCF